MPEDLQHLLQRIQAEAVDISEREAEEIISKARIRASAIVREAEDKAKSLLSQAEKDANAYLERSTRALEQAGRDLLITVGQGIQKSIEGMVGEAVKECFDEGFLREQISKIITSYLVDPDGQGGIEVLVGSNDRDPLVEFVRSRFQNALSQGVVLREGAGIRKGFRISYDQGNAFHDFSSEAVAEALCSFLRPNLVKILHSVARESTGVEKPYP